MREVKDICLESNQIRHFDFILNIMRNYYNRARNQARYFFFLCPIYRVHFKNRTISYIISNHQKLVYVRVLNIMNARTCLFSVDITYL